MFGDDRRRDEERRRYYGDVVYDVWRSGGDPDAINLDRVWDSYYHGLSADEAADREIRVQDEARRFEREAYSEEDA